MSNLEAEGLQQQMTTPTSTPFTKEKESDTLAGLENVLTI